VRVGRLAAILAIALLPGCAFQLGRRQPLVTIRPGDLPPLADDLDVATFRQAIERTLPAWTRNRDSATPDAARALATALAAEPDPAARRKLVGELFRVVKVREPILLTAYYEPELPARRTRDARYRYPIYARPPDLVEIDPSKIDASCACNNISGQLQGRHLVPYPSRAEIDAGALSGRGLELAWTADPLGLFMLQVQGSGRLRLTDGKLLGIRFAGTNGRPYRSLARTMMDRGLIPKGRATMPEIRRYLAEHPDEQAALLARNERYIFFRIAPGEPIGSLGVPLTPGRSIASDARLVPPGSIGYLRTPSYSRFVVSQDAGAAIVGPHADIFLGAGSDAEERAGRTNERGVLYLLQPLTAGPPVAAGDARRVSLPTPARARPKPTAG
jgi:membrane-bound lytic murein transglycosylase A